MRLLVSAIIACALVGIAFALAVSDFDASCVHTCGPRGGVLVQDFFGRPACLCQGAK